MLESGRRINVLDGWRGLSIVLVLLGHFFEKEISNINLGVLGVELFFVLSGRLMADILFVRQAPLLEFYRRRLSRILPGLGVFLVIVWFATLDTPISFKPIAGVTAMFFVFNYANVFIGHHVLAIEHIWSLCVEEHTYVLLGLLALAARLWKWHVKAVLISAAALSLLDGFVSTALGQGYFTVFWRTDAHISSILLGCIAYLVTHELRDRKVKIPQTIVPIAMSIALSVQFMHPKFAHTLYLSLGTGSAAIAVANLEYSATWLQRTLNFPPLRWLGMLSFSLYLWQQPFYRWAVAEPSIWAKAGLMLVAVGVGAISYYIVEQPSRRWLNSLQLDKLIGSRRQHVVAAPRKEAQPDAQANSISGAD